VYIRGHAILSTLCGIGLYPFFGNEIFIPWVVSVSLDIDHYLWYCIRYRKFSIRKAMNLFEKRLDRSSLCVLHLIEVWLFVGVLSLFSRCLMLIFIGMTFHLALDMYGDMRDVYNEIRKEQPGENKRFRVFEYLKKQEQSGRKLSLSRYILLSKRGQL